MKEKKEQIEAYEPHSVDAERSLLGAMMMSKDAIEKMITMLHLMHSTSNRIAKSLKQ